MAFDPWAQYNQGLSNLGQTIQGLGQQDMQRQSMQRQNSLADLQMQQTQSAMARDELNAPMEAKQRQATIISLDDKLAEYGAKVATGQGDINEYYKGKQSLDRMKQMGEAIKPYMNKPGALQAIWPQLVQAYPEFKTIDPNIFKATPDGIMTPFKTPDGKEVPNMFYLYDNEGKMQIKEIKPQPQGKIIDKTVDLGDKVIIQYTDGTEKTMPKAARPDTVIRMGQGGTGKAPAGYRYTANGDMEAIPGGPADVKAETKRQSVESGKAAIDASVETIDKLLNHPGRVAATGFSSLNPINKIPGTNASDFNKELESFDSKLFLSNIQAMKGMGALSNAEGAKVSAAAGAIKAGMSEKAFVNNMNVIKKALYDAKSRIDSGNTIQPRPTAQVGNVRKIGKYAVEVH